MKTQLSTLVCLFFILTTISTPLAAQTKGVINYIYTVNDGMPGSPRTMNYALSLSGSKSIEVPLRKTRFITPEMGSEGISEGVINTGIKKPFLYKDLGNKKLTLSEYISINPYLVSDTLHNFKWDISNEQTKILDFTCTKATTSFRGRKYIAWFAEDIAIPFGPWKFGGLPGLIISVSDEEEKYKYELSGLDLKSNFDLKLISIPAAYAKDTPLLHREFNQLFLTKKAELRTKTRIISYGTNSSTSSSFTLPDRMELF